jgi:DNA processing protein
MAKEELYHILALAKVEGIGVVLAKNLIAYCGSAKNVFSTSKGMLRKVPGIGAQVIQNIIQFRNYPDVEAELRFIEKNSIEVCTFYDKNYPYRLKNIYDAPLFLFSLGKPNLNPKRSIAIVGTRKPSVYGRHLCSALVEELSAYDCQIISGLAYGIDGIAHQHALKTNSDTTAVLAHGLDRIYPSIHKNLARRIVENKGGLVTEHMSFSKPDRENFPRRNRIVAGLADAVVVVESPKKGGSMITAEFAWDFDRPLFVFPGRTSDKNSQGCLGLIKQHKAFLIESANDILLQMNWAKSKSAVQVPLFELNAEEQLIVRVLQHEKIVHIEKLVEKSGMNAGKLAYLLLELEFKKMILCKPGKLYELA